MSIGERIKERRLDLGLTLLQIAEELGVKEATAQRYESGAIKNIKYKTLIKLAIVLKCTPEYLLGLEKRANKGVKIPVLGKVQAGIPVEAVEDIIDYEEITQEMAKQGEFFGLQIKGDSMQPRMLEGDVVIVRKQSSVDSGDIAVVLINGSDATIKRLICHESGISLIALNPAYPPRFYTNNEIESLPITILGKVVELRGKF